jgi:pimeloyl-ACP methyl ester carboxylesterase
VRVASHRFATPDCTLAVYDWGGDGDPVLLAHPTGFHGRAWAPVAARLVAAERHVWSFDFHGHGDSDAPPIEDHDYSWPTFADDVLAVAAHVGIAGDPRLTTVGHSKGATALLLGEAKRPGTFPRIWAYEPIMFPGESPQAPDDDFFLARSARKRRNEWQSRAVAFAAYASKPPLDVLTPEALHAYVDDGLRDRGDGVFELKCRPEVEGRIYAMGPSNGGWDALSRIQAQVLVACGESSRDIDPEFGARIAERLPNGRIEIRAGLGHFGPQQDPDGCAASVLRFADESGYGST